VLSVAAFLTFYLSESTVSDLFCSHFIASCHERQKKVSSRLKVGRGINLNESKRVKIHLKIRWAENNSNVFFYKLKATIIVVGLMDSLISQLPIALNN